MKIVKNNGVCGDLYLILFVFLIFSGFSLFFGDTDSSSYDTEDAIVENFSLGEEAILPGFNENDAGTYYYKLQKFQSSTNQFSSTFISDFESIIKENLRFSNNFYGVSNKIPVYILCKQQRISDDDVIPLLSFV